MSVFVYKINFALLMATQDNKGPEKMETNIIIKAHYSSIQI
jgi:hypothetical protein